MKCKKNTESRTPKAVKKKRPGRIMLLSKCIICDNEKLKFIKEQEAGGLLNCLGIKTPLSKITSVGFKTLFTYSACGPFTKNKERI